jgi:hypothetical protein
MLTYDKGSWFCSEAVSPRPGAMAELSPERREMVQQFMAICEATEDLARDFLADNRWQLEESINTYMLMVGDDGGAAGARGSGAGGGGGAAREAASGPGEVNGGAQGEAGDEEMAAALAASMDAEHDDESITEEILDSEVAKPPISTRSERGNISGGLPVESAAASQRNFAAEGMAVPLSSAPAPDDGLESLFPPPKEIMFTGNFDALRKSAEEERKYCLVCPHRRAPVSGQAPVAPPA